jgi:hypothetical protein
MSAKHHPNALLAGRRAYRIGSVGISPYLRRLREAVGHELLLVPAPLTESTHALFEAAGVIVEPVATMHVSAEQSSRVAIGDRGVQ